MLGKYELNKIYNEDSYKAIKDITDNSIDCIYTDIPYLIIGGKAGSSKLSQRIGKTQKEDLINIVTGIDYKILNDFIRISKKLNLYIWCSKLQINDIMNYFISRGYFFEILTWNKSNPTPQTQSKWLPDIEYCLYFREKGVKLNDGYHLKSKWYNSSINKQDKYLFNHPTIKPLDLVKRHLEHTTQENDIVADFFIGSGTTAVACKELNRNYIGFEIDKQFHKIAVDRVNGITASGQTSIFTDFDKLEEVTNEKTNT
jgi:DNA modification methylase